MVIGCVEIGSPDCKYPLARIVSCKCPLWGERSRLLLWRVLPGPHASRWSIRMHWWSSKCNCALEHETTQIVCVTEIESMESRPTQGFGVGQSVGQRWGF